ncbi:hypothetical protein FK949_gp224 [Paramecium bursaria Chlorella virus NYs1]|uniref:Uncharacterized protein n=1 Tax=Paramecium bursaria Chlorella virus NYs1 TaxID=83442 RepID=M1I9C5_9PHYC|nr:hypothetical protein AR158_C726L [Paramecium bursaria Chlorella virus AR158]YP_009665546.1 hypothetical protein FK949_gp224 [Paramecium bursaria Chlorella virus NYs1]AGE54402.1 hypothetical protein PBCVIL52s1_855L [Paramecium bursaria Chlorella virus IL-5-2s1]AGE55084.1 hypothetical protein PBCVMA1D_828L [Paramecium bursaria Chlorella virus MA1D]ABU44271.1 hypothetical protein AR158_C726L [Paramecium bursaria Chlorella virus AR158]AGE58901.1 hypothetical protein PBCVNYs1_836L [Paramecium bu
MSICPKKIIRNQVICMATQQVVVDPILSSLTSFVLAYAISKKNHLMQRRFDKLVCHKKIIHTAKTLPLSIGTSFVDTNNDHIQDMIVTNLHTHHEITHEVVHGIMFLLKIISVVV